MSEDRMKYFQSFHCKPLALAHSCFDEVILFDQDIIPLQNIQKLFEVPAYNLSGALFFHDFRFRMSSGRASVSMEKVRKLYQKLLSVQPGYDKELGRHLSESFLWRNISADTQESSIVVVDRTRHKGMMEMLIWIYKDPSLIESLCGSRGKLRGRFVDEYIHGDKELYWLAAALAGEPVSFSPWSGSVYHPCENLIAQYDPAVEEDPNILWINGNKYWQSMPVIKKKGVGCARPFNSDLKFGKRCGDLCDLKKNEANSLLQFKYFVCRANLLTSQLCWPLKLGFSMDWLSTKSINLGPMWRNLKWFRKDMSNI